MKDDRTEFNHHSANLRHGTPSTEGGKGFIEQPSDQYYNFAWQTRPRPLSVYESNLAQSLETIFATGATDLADIITGLNRSGARAPDGNLWTQESFVSTMSELSEMAGVGIEQDEAIGGGIIPA